MSLYVLGLINLLITEEIIQSDWSIPIFWKPTRVAQSPCTSTLSSRPILHRFPWSLQRWYDSMIPCSGKLWPPGWDIISSPISDTRSDLSFPISTDTSPAGWTPSNFPRCSAPIFLSSPYIYPILLFATNCPVIYLSSRLFTNVWYVNTSLLRSPLVKLYCMS